MGRTMRPVDPDAGPVERFACELRALRALAGSVPFWKLARRCAVSKSALAAAAAGRQLPSEKVTREFVRVCGGDWDWWQERWSQAAAEALSNKNPSTAAGGQLAVRVTPVLDIRRANLPRKFEAQIAGEERERQNAENIVPPPNEGEKRNAVSQPHGLHRPWWINSLIAAACGAAITLCAQNLPALFSHPTEHRAVSAPHLTAAAGRKKPVPQHAPAGDGLDPRDTGCDADGITVGIADIVIPNSKHVVVGQAIARYSPSCHALWPRFEPTPVLDRTAPHAHVTLTAVRPVDRRRTSFDDDYRGAFIWGNMLLTSTGCVTVSVQIDDRSLPTPAIASTPCVDGS
jgi:hypothetical protein